MSEKKEKMDAGRWKRVENLTRYVRVIAVGGGAMDRLRRRRAGDGEKGSAGLGNGM